MPKENNRRVAEMLRQIAVLLDEEGVSFKPAAYRRAAVSIEESSRDIASFKTVKELKAIPGVGDAIARKILEYFKTGKMHTLEELLLVRGGISPHLLQIENLGPKRARQFQQELGVTTVPALIQAAEAGKLRTLPRFSALMEKKILESARRVEERNKRFPLAEIRSDVEKLLSVIRSVPGVMRCAAAGSFRREKPTVGDVDILLVTASAQTVGDAIAKLSIVRGVVAHGARKISFDLLSGLRVDIRLVREDQWGAALLYFTGSKEHNIEMRKRAIQRGWKLNEYGLFEGENILASKTEEEIYKALDLPFVEPKQRSEVLS